MDKNNQPACPPRLASYDMSLDHKITNQYMNSGLPMNQSSIYTQNVPMPVKGGSTYNNIQNNYYNSMNRPNHIQGYPPPRVQQQQRLNSNSGDLSMQPVNNYVPPLSSQNISIINPVPNNSQYSDFNNKFYQNSNQTKKLGFFDIVPNLKTMFKQNKLSKWTLIFIIVQVIIIVTLETLLFINNKHFHNKFKDIKSKIKESSEYEEKYNQSICLMIYQLIFIVAQLFVLIIYYDSFRISSSIQLITISIFNFIIAGYSFRQIFQTTSLFEKISKTEEFETSNDNELRNLMETKKYSQIHAYIIAIASVLIFSAVVLLVMSLFLFKKFGWNIYRNVGADIEKTVILKRRYKFGIVLKFKIFFIFGIIAQCVMFSDDDVNINWNDIGKTIESIIKGSAAYALAIILVINIICGYFSVKKKNNFLMCIYILTDMIFIIFSAYMIYIIYTDDQFKAVTKSLTGFASIEIIILLISLYYSISVMADFNTSEIIKESESNQIGRRLSL